MKADSLKKKEENICTKALYRQTLSTKNDSK